MLQQIVVESVERFRSRRGSVVVKVEVECAVKEGDENLAFLPHCLQTLKKENSNNVVADCKIKESGKQ